MREVQALVAQGREAVSRNDLKAAREAFNAALTRMPSGEDRFEAQEMAEIAEAWYEAFARQGDTAEGREAAQEAAAYARLSMQKDPSQAAPHYTLGRVSRDLGQLEGAIAELQEAARLDSGNYRYAFDLGRAYFANRDYNGARQSFENTVNLNRSFESAWYNLGGAYRSLGRPDDALASYRRAVGVKPEYAAAHREIGRILNARDDFRGAAEAFAKALEYAPNDVASARELGAAQMAGGEYAAAEASFERALRATPDDDQTNYNMAVVKLSRDKGDEALGYAQKAAELVPGSALYAYTLGLAAEAAGEFEAAAAAYGRAISLDAAYIRPRINLGNLYLDNGFAEEALRLLTAAYDREPASFEVNNNLGAAYAR
ncbi:MAG: tetratricopeptide repeat protein, partial [Treponema sp.]|nr:tetratricopeptide repeat protein [Treponema sp.]